jgi:hypothetical protein
MFINLDSDGLNIYKMGSGNSKLKLYPDYEGSGATIDIDGVTGNVSATGTGKFSDSGNSREVSLGAAEGALYATDSSSSVYLLDGGYALNVDGDTMLNGAVWTDDGVSGAVQGISGTFNYIDANYTNTEGNMTFVNGILVSQNSPS